MDLVAPVEQRISVKIHVGVPTDWHAQRAHFEPFLCILNHLDPDINHTIVHPGHGQLTVDTRFRVSSAYDYTG